MSTSAIPSYTNIAILRILDEYTDDAHPLSITKLRRLLDTIYGIKVSDDTVRKQVKGIIAFNQLTHPKKREEFNTPALFPGTIVEFQPQGRGNPALNGVRMSSRMFSDAEVKFIAAAVQTVADTDPTSGGDFMERVHSLQGVNARKEAKAEAEGAKAAATRAGDAGNPRIGITHFAYALAPLDEAIREHRTVSFDYVRLEMRPCFPTRKLVAVSDGPRRQDLSAYRLECVNGHYCLIAGSESNGATVTRAYRVDLMRKLAVSETSARYVEFARSTTFATTVDEFPQARTSRAA